MNRKELIAKLDYWSSDDILPRLSKIVETMDYIFGLDDRYIGALLIKRGGDKWSEFRSFYDLLHEWIKNPGIDIVDRIANNMTWFHMIMGVECTKLSNRIEELEASCMVNEQMMRDTLGFYRKYVGDFCQCFYVAHAYSEIYREYAFENNASFTIVEAQEFYESIMKSVVMYILYGKKNVVYELKPPSGHGGEIDILRFLNNDGEFVPGYIITHNVKCFINMAYAHIRSYEWLLDSTSEEDVYESE